MVARLSVTTFALSFLTAVVYGGSQHDGAYPASGLNFGQFPFLDNNYSLFSSGGSLHRRQIQGCQSDPTSIACPKNNTVCCSEDYPTCCVAQDWCCQEGYHCCPQDTCCTTSDNCYIPKYCCPKTAQTCGRHYCLASDQSCCGDSFCDSGFECMKTPNGTSTCCKPDEKPCNGNYCCPSRFTCSGGGICKPPPSSSATPSVTQQISSSAGAASSATATPGDAGAHLVERSLSPLLSLLLIVVPFGLFL